MPEPLIRVLNHGGERWLNLAELVKLADGREDLLMQSCSMLVVAHQQGHTAAIRNDPMAPFIPSRAAGDDDGEVIEATERPAQRLLDVVRLAQDYYDALAAIRDGEQPDGKAFAKEFLGDAARPAIA